MKQLLLTIMCLTLAFASCSDESIMTDSTNSSTETEQNSSPNILLVIADDMGMDALPDSSIECLKPEMPTLQNLMQQGLTFTNLWSNPTCTSTRATILTGKYGFRTGVLKVDDELPTSEISVQQYMATNTANSYATAVIGKWHLSRDLNHPMQFGFDYYAGSLSGTLASYWNWDLVENGESIPQTEYATTRYTDLAIDWIQEQDKPWFLWLAHNAPHSPFHLPPAHLHNQQQLTDDQASIDANPLPYYLASLEALDTELGRLLQSMDQATLENTLIIFMGDNGTPSKVAQQYPSRRSKGTVYQGGVNVPLVISGTGVQRINATEHALINSTDLFATIAGFSGVSVNRINDSYNFGELIRNASESDRSYTYSESGPTSLNTTMAIRNSGYKYIHFENGNEALYDLTEDPFELTNRLLNNQPELNDSETDNLNGLINTLNELRGN